MTTRPDWQPAQVRALLQARGYDVDPVDTRYGDNSVTARRERGGFTQLVAVDRGGRFRAELTVATGETRRSTTIGAVPVVVVSRNLRTMTVTGSLPSWNHLAGVLTQLDEML